MKNEATSLMGLPYKKINAGLQKLQAMGVTPDRWLKMLDAPPNELKRIVAEFPGVPRFASRHNVGIVYDVFASARLFNHPSVGIPNRDDVVPKARDGEIIIYYGGWDLPALNRFCKERFFQKSCSDLKAVEPGYYRIILQVPESATDIRYERHIKQSMDYLSTMGGIWQQAPTAVVGTALLLHLLQTGQSLIDKEWCECQNAADPERHTMITCEDGVIATYDVSSVSGNKWFSACQKC